MQKYIDALHTYLTENELKHRCPNVNSLLDMLYCCYRQDCEFDTQEVRACIDELYQAAESTALSAVMISSAPLTSYAAPAKARPFTRVWRLDSGSTASYTPTSEIHRYP